jgi:hypothetical protein
MIVYRVLRQRAATGAEVQVVRRADRRETVFALDVQRIKTETSVTLSRAHIPQPGARFVG